MSDNSISDSELLRLAYSDLQPFLELIGAGADGSKLIRDGGVVSAVAPAGKHSSLLNSTVYSDPVAMAAAIPRLAAEYRDAGVRAWGVWVNDSDQFVREALTNAGLHLDSTPTAMGADVRELRLRDAPPPGVTTTEVWDTATFCAINESAYGLSPGAFAGVFAQSEGDESAHCFFAMRGGTAVSCAVTCHTPDGDCGVFMVGTLKELHGQGLGRIAMEAALRHAVAAGCKTTSLQASATGLPLYAAMGYRHLGHAIELWEYRDAA